MVFIGISSGFAFSELLLSCASILDENIKNVIKNTIKNIGLK
jgi:hypothetical protein